MISVVGRSFASLLSISLAIVMPLSSAKACSPAAGYETPTTSQMVDNAAFIVIAEVVGENSTENIASPDNIIVHPTKLLKGPYLPGDLTIFGRMAGAVVENGGLRFRIEPPAPRNPLHLLTPHPEGSLGSCTRYTFSKGLKLLPFVELQEGRLHVFTGPFSRSLEDIPSDNAPWVKAVMNYVQLEHLGERDRRKALAAKVVVLRKSGSAEDKAIADEIEWNQCSLKEGSPMDNCRTLYDKTFVEDEAADAWFASTETILPRETLHESAITSRAALGFTAAGALLLAGLALYFCRKRT